MRTQAGCVVAFVTMFQIFSWNVRGRNDLNKRCLVKSVVSRLKEYVLCFQKSKVESVFRSFLRSFVGSNFDKCYFVKSDDASGGIITCWSSKIFACSGILVRNYSLTVQLKQIASGAVFSFTNVYGPPG